MVKISEIINSINETKATKDEQKDYPLNPGIYCFFLNKSSHFSEFTGEQILYVGIAKDSLKNRDFSQHFKSGKTGSSTLRRSIGAVLKESLGLKAIPRGGKNDSKRVDNYKFSDDSEEKLTQWMNVNLQIGYWEDKNGLDYKTELRELEKQVIIELKPLLDLDKRTVKYNNFAERLRCLRDICKKEVCDYIKENE